MRAGALAAVVLLLGAAPTTPAPRAVLLKGRVVARLDSGDIVHPRFSPAGDRLAFATVEVRDGVETTGLAIFDLKEGRARSLLDPAEATRYAAYKAFVIDLSWTDDLRLRATLSDGDVGATYLSYDVPSGRLVETVHEEEDDGASNVDPAVAKISADCPPLPELPPEVLESALSHDAVVAGPRRVILQKNYAGQDDDIWLLDCSARSLTRLVRLEGAERAALGGGVSFASSTLFLVSRKSRASLMRLKGGKVAELATIPGNASHKRIELKQAAADRLYVQVRAQESYEGGDNPLFVFDGTRLRRVADFADLYDFDVTPDGTLAAFCAWQGERRIVEIRRLK